MRADGVNPREALLRLCAASAPGPWFPRAYAKGLGVPLDELLPHLEYLWQEGLVVKAVAPGEPLPGLTPSEAGARALDNPDLLDRVCRGLPIARRDRVATARRAAFGAVRPLVNRALVGVNLLFFGYGVWLAWRWHALEAFLAGSTNSTVAAVFRASGSLDAMDVVRGDGWRLLAASFAHGGLLHLLMNLAILAQAGAYAEAAWGRARYLLVYLVAALCGNCTSLALTAGIVTVNGPNGPEAVPIELLGASGAICGVLAAQGVWVLLNGRYLLRAQDRALRAGLLAALVLLTFISLFPGVSGWAHLGGAVAGGTAALLLHFQRWGPAPWRCLGLAGAAAMPTIGLAVLEYARTTDLRWNQAEQLDYRHHFSGRVSAVLGRAGRLFDQAHGPGLLGDRPARRDPDLVTRMLPQLESEREQLEQLADEVVATGHYRAEAVEGVRNEDADRLVRTARVLGECERQLREGANTPELDGREEREFDRVFTPRVTGTLARVIDRYAREVRPLISQAPASRDVGAVVRALVTLGKLRREPAALAGELGEAGPYGNGVVERARQVGRRYAEALVTLFEAAETALREDRAAAAVGEPERKAAAARGEWQRLLEH